MSTSISRCMLHSVSLAFMQLTVSNRRQTMPCTRCQHNTGAHSDKPDVTRRSDPITGPRYCFESLDSSQSTNGGRSLQVTGRGSRNCSEHFSPVASHRCPLAPPSQPTRTHYLHRQILMPACKTFRRRCPHDDIFNRRGRSSTSRFVSAGAPASGQSRRANCGLVIFVAHSIGGLDLKPSA